jgi:hypothetical protein
VTLDWPGPAGLLAAIRAMTWGVQATVTYASPSTVAAFAELEDFLHQPLREDASGDARGLAERLAEADVQAAAAASKAADAIAPGLQAARAQMVDALFSVAPEAALHLLRTSEAAVRIEHYESTRFGWLLATMGRGSAAALSDWNHYAEINGGPISLGRGARPQVWLQLLRFRLLEREP